MNGRDDSVLLHPLRRVRTSVVEVLQYAPLHLLRPARKVSGKSEQLLDAGDLPESGVVGGPQQLVMLEEEGIVGLREEYELPQHALL